MASKLHRFSAPLLVVVFLAVSIPALLTSVPAQLRPLAYDEGALALAFALRKLPVTAGVLHTAAHPDDEDNGLLVMLSRGRGVRTGLLTLTRGSGGQNEIGPELFDALGILRTEELMSMHRFDQARQFFGRANDFGYSFSVQETFKKWGEQEMLADVVRVIRTFRPDVILTLPPGGTGGGQHHQAAARITLEAFRSAADPHQFPEQIQEGLLPWQAGKIYTRQGWGGGGNAARTSVTEETGVFDPLLGRSYFQVGMEARSYHRCQGMGQLIPLPGDRSSRWSLADAAIEIPAHESGLLDGIEVGLSAMKSRVKGEEEKAPFLPAMLTAIQEQIQAAGTAYDVHAPEKTVPSLARGLALLRDLGGRIEQSGLSERSKYELLFLVSRKEDDFQQALRYAHQLSLEAVVDDGMVIPGQPFQLEVRIANGSRKSIPVEKFQIDTPAGWTVNGDRHSQEHIPARGTLLRRFAVTAPPEAELTRPYWEPEAKYARYRWVRPEDATRPWSPPPLRVKAVYVSDQISSALQAAAQYRYEGPWVGGEQRHELMIVPAVSLRVDPEIAIIPLDQTGGAREIRVTAHYNGRNPASGALDLRAPAGWRVTPSQVPLTFDSEGQSITRKFQVSSTTPALRQEFEITAVASLEGKEYREGYQVIDYHHIQRRLFYRPSRVTVKTVDVKVRPNVKVGYIVGVGDQVPQALQQLGVEFDFLSEDDLAYADLNRYDVILTGVRAYLNRRDLAAFNQRLLEWVKEGGTMIVQYNKFEFNGDSPNGRSAAHSPYAPYPAQVGRGRITDETAPVKVLVPDHPLFTTPNRITEADWQGWVQERGLYFLGQKDSRYQDLVSMEDPFEYNRGVKLGALVEARYGKGRWVYVGLGLWRQLPAGGPGAYRIFANLLSLGQ